MTKALIVAIAASLAAPAFAAEPAPAETFIPDVSGNGIEQWKADGKRGLYIKSIAGDWYYATTMGPCGRLRTAVSLGFVTVNSDQLDRDGAIIAEGWRCPLTSVVRSQPPPAKAKKRG